MEEADDTAHDLAPIGRDHGALENGTDVGGYIVDGELGRGGMGIVYSATHPVIGKRVAVKVLKPSLSENPAAVDRFVNEARAVNQIGHPNIVDIFGFGALPDGRSYYLMDLLVGESLRARLKRGALHVREAAQVIDEVASALEAAHGKGFIHRDLKPDNVFLVAHPGRIDVKLLDFGLAKLMPTAGTRAFRTATGAQLGTPDYMSPEQLRGADAVDPRTDIYSLGVTALEMLTGRRPRRFSDGVFEGGTAAQILAGVALLPGDFAQLVAAMVERDPGDRPTLVAVRSLLRRVRPSLPSISIVGLELRPPSVPPEDSVPSSLYSTALGARPVLPTPPAGAPVAPPAPSAPPASPPSPAVSDAQLAALRPISAHGGTKLGVPPPPGAPARTSMPHLVAAPAAPAPAGAARGWLVVAAVLVLVAAIVLVVVLAS